MSYTDSWSRTWIGGKIKVYILGDNEGFTVGTLRDFGQDYVEMISNPTGPNPETTVINPANIVAVVPI